MPLEPSRGPPAASHLPASATACCARRCRPVETQMANLECNAVSAVQVTHLLLGRMRAKKLRGCFVYTSSGRGLDMVAVLAGVGKRADTGSCC